MIQIACFLSFDQNADRTEKIDREYLRREALLKPTRSDLLASEAG